MFLALLLITSDFLPNPSLWSWWLSGLGTSQGPGSPLPISSWAPKCTPVAVLNSLLPSSGFHSLSHAWSIERIAKLKLLGHSFVHSLTLQRFLRDSGCQFWATCALQTHILPSGSSQSTHKKKSSLLVILRAKTQVQSTQKVRGGAAGPAVCGGVGNGAGKTSRGGHLSWNLKG